MDLRKLAKKHGTDKSVHGYCPHYERRFAGWRHKPITLLEIGVDAGASMRMWRDYFPNAKITGVDINPSWMPNDGLLFIRKSTEAQI